MQEILLTKALPHLGTDEVLQSDRCQRVQSATNRAEQICRSRSNFKDFRNLREPEKTPAIKSPGRPGIAPATSRTMNGTNWSWRNGLMLIILKKIFVYRPVFWLFLLWEGRSQHRLHTKRGPAIRPTQPRIWFQIITILTRNPIIQMTFFRWR